MKWYVRSFFRLFLHFLPFRTTLREAKRKIVPLDTGKTIFVLNQAISIACTLKESGYKFEGSTILELGVGWQPIFPVIFSFFNPKVIYLVDKNRLMFEPTVHKTLGVLLERSDLIAEKLSLDKTLVAEKLSKAMEMPLDKLLSFFNLDYQSPRDARNLDLPGESVDLVYSYCVLEHIPPVIIAGLLKEFNRVLRKNGQMVHIIDNSDHWSHYDKSITSINFLKFEERTWAFFNINPIDYQNRLRGYEFEKMFQDAGFVIPEPMNVVNTTELAALEKIKICRKYRDVDKRLLATTALKYFLKKT